MDGYVAGGGEVSVLTTGFFCGEYQRPRPDNAKLGPVKVVDGHFESNARQFDHHLKSWKRPHEHTIIRLHRVAVENLLLQVCDITMRFCSANVIEGRIKVKWHGKYMPAARLQHPEYLPMRLIGM